METVADKYVVECTPDGEYYAYLCNHEQCFAYGETEEEALENLETAAEEFYNEFNSTQLYTLLYQQFCIIKVFVFSVAQLFTQ